MWYKKFCRVWIGVIVFVICVYYSVMILFSHLIFMDDEVAHYLENEEYSKCHKNYAKVLVMGDSTAKAGFVPKILGKDVYNFALGGTSPVDNYFYLREYLQRNDIPKTVILGFLPEHFRHGGCFWNRSVYFHRISYNDLLEINSIINNFKVTENIGKDNFLHECLSYYFYSYEKYGQAFKVLLNGKYKSRYKYNKAKYSSLKENSGQCYFGTAKECHNLNGETKLATFIESDLIEYYFNQIVKLCSKNNIQLIVCAMPINSSSYKALKDEYKNKYNKFLQKIGNQSCNTIVEKDICVFDDTCFGDATHLNEKGSRLFSEKVKGKYKEYFN